MREEWRRSFPGQFYVTTEGGRVVVVSERRVEVGGREYILSASGVLDVGRGGLRLSEGPADVPLYIRREGNLWTVERISGGEVLWSRSFEEGEVSATLVGRVVFVAGLDEGRSCAYVLAAESGDLLWSVRKDQEADFFITPVGSASGERVVSVTWLNGVNVVSSSSAGRLVFLEVTSDPLSESGSAGDELYAVDCVDGSILWREVHDLIETREVEGGVIVECLDGSEESERCQVKFVTGDGRVAWSREYGGYVRIFSSGGLVALESGGSIDVVRLSDGRRLLSLSGLHRRSIALGKLLSDRVVVEEYGPTKSKHSLKAYDFSGRLLWEVYLSPEGSALMDLSDDRYGAVYVRRHVYLVDLADGSVVKSIRTGRLASLTLRYPYLVATYRSPPLTRVYDVVSGLKVLEASEPLRGGDVVPVEGGLLVRLEGELVKYSVARHFVTCSYPRVLCCQRGSSSSLRYEFSRVDGEATLYPISSPPLRIEGGATKVREPRVVEWSLAVPSDAKPGIYEVVAVLEGLGTAKRLVTQVIVNEK